MKERTNERTNERTSSSLSSFYDIRNKAHSSHATWHGPEPWVAPAVSIEIAVYLSLSLSNGTKNIEVNNLAQRILSCWDHPIIKGVYGRFFAMAHWYFGDREKDKEMAVSCDIALQFCSHKTIWCAAIQHFLIER
jgi:hypothetical protein